MKIDINLADYSNPKHAGDLVTLLDIYSRDKMGSSKPLPLKVKENLVTELSKRPHAFSILCYVDERPAGLINCFEGFSTFKCRPLVNIHDIIVHPEYRGYGLSHKMLAKVEEEAKKRGCCKLTLEVLDGNHIAKKSYTKFGFNAYELDPSLGHALFWERTFD